MALLTAITGVGLFLYPSYSPRLRPYSSVSQHGVHHRMVALTGEALGMIMTKPANAFLLPATVNAILPLRCSNHHLFVLPLIVT